MQSCVAIPGSVRMQSWLQCGPTFWGIYLPKRRNKINVKISITQNIFKKQRGGKDRFSWKMRENKVELLNSIFPTVKERIIGIKIAVLDILWHF